MDYLKGLESIVEHKKGMLKSKNDKIVRDLFAENTRFSGNENIGDNMILGWHTVGFFEERGGRLYLKELFQAGKCEHKFENETYSQVTTRAVDSCTFVHIVIGNEHIIAHLDRNDLTDDNEFSESKELDRWGLSTIQKYIGNRQNEAKGFCSHVYGNIENKFSEELKKICKKGYTELLRHSGDISSWENLSEVEVCRISEKNYYGHMEIGLGVENGRLQLSGDITDLSTNDMSVRSWRFTSQDELMEIKDHEIK